MDLSIVTIISSAVTSLLTPYFKKVLEKGSEKIGEFAGQSAIKGIADLYEVISKRFKSDPKAKLSIEELSHSPTNNEKQNEFEQSLIKIMQNDDAFALQVANLLKKADELGVDVAFNTNIHGKVQKFVQIGVVRGDVNI